MTKDVIAKLQNLTLLYAEDEEGIRKNIADSLSYYVKEVIEASNGAEAFELYEQKKPDIILSDIHMPILNGIEATNILRKEHNIKTPIIALTANSLEGDKDKFLENGMDDYLSKPFNLEKFIEIINKYS